jgi:hypothetical protein
MFVRDYYTVSIPGDLSEEMNDLENQAITEARERAKLFAIPCEWSVKLIKGEIGSYEVVFRVCRKRNKRILTKSV